MRQTRPELWVAPSKQLSSAVSGMSAVMATKWHRPADCSIHWPQPPETHGHRQLTVRLLTNHAYLKRSIPDIWALPQRGTTEPVSQQQPTYISKNIGFVSKKQINITTQRQPLASHIQLRPYLEFTIRGCCPAAAQIQVQARSNPLTWIFFKYHTTLGRVVWYRY